MSTKNQQNVFKLYHSDKHFSEFLPTSWRQKSTGIDTEQNYVTVTQYISMLYIYAISYSTHIFALTFDLDL